MFHNKTHYKSFKKQTTENPKKVNRKFLNYTYQFSVSHPASRLNKKNTAFDNEENRTKKVCLEDTNRRECVEEKIRMKNGV